MQLSDHVYIFPHHPDITKVRPNIGIAISSAGSLVIDTGNSPAHAREVQAALDAINAPPVTHVIYTHFHWDHICGTQVFNGATVTGHQRTYDHISEMQTVNWGKDYLKERGKEHPRMFSLYQMLINLIDWDTFELVAPTDTFEETRHTANMNGLEITLEHVGGQHADDSVVITVDDVMFLGDCYYPPSGSRFKIGNPPDYAMLERLLDSGHRLYVAGHAPPFSPQEGYDWLTQQRQK